jgi:alanine racemase
VVKADAYGHGLAPVSATLMQCGIDAFAVATLSEALSLRQIGGDGWPILLFGSALPFEAAAMLDHNITPTISTLDEAHLFEQEARQRGKTVDVHIEVDTGMGRVGFWHEDAAKNVLQITTLPHLRIAGLYTHFPSADENPGETRRELGLFQAVVQQLAVKDVNIPSLHAANSAAMLTLPESHLNMVRTGLILYGITPNAPHGSTPQRSNEFRPLLSFKARVAFVKDVAAGRTVSYGQTFTAENPMRIATVTAGYADGFSRHLSNKAEVLVGGKRCPVIGRVTIDQIMVDVTQLPNVQCGDEVVFIGGQGDAQITASDVARWEDTIPWEVLCGITKSARVPRVYRGAAAA